MYISGQPWEYRNTVNIVAYFIKNASPGGQESSKKGRISVTKGHRTLLSALAAGTVLFLTARFLLPLLLPFLLGAGLALVAEPMASFFTRRLRMPRGVSAGISVTMAFAFLALLLLLLAALVVREVRFLAGAIPDLEQTAKSGIGALSAWLQELTYLAPAGLQSYLSGNIAAFFSNGTALLDRAAGWVLNAASGVLSQVPDGALGLGTALIASYMISAKLPAIRRRLASLGEKLGLPKVLPVLRQLRAALGGWLLAQMKLCGVTWIIVTLGFVVLKIPFAPLWALLVALVDAFPVLGTGTVLLPWALVCFLQGNTPQAIGLLGIYAAGALTRSILEPRLVGKQLGLDPLVTLFALYAGYKLWGLGGMLLAPILAVTGAQLLRARREA